MAVCPVCGAENPERAKFCLECGSPLGQDAPAPLVHERKIVTVLFCDVVGFTEASETADPEDVRARMEAYYRHLQPVIASFGGSVEKLIGDAVMAVFGAPLAHEDDPERAVRAGLAIVDAIGELNAVDPNLELAVRVGINTGEVLLSLGATQVESEVLGDAVNTAARVQGAAPVNAVAVSEQTYRATDRVFEWERLEPAAVKGKSAPLALFRPLRARARLGSDVIRTHSTPLVGRGLEKQLLIGTFERATQQASCQLVSIVGEPGVGKSRLCSELLAHAEERPGVVRWRQGRCLPYGDGISFWALGEIVKAECGILESDTPALAATKLERTLVGAGAERAWLLARLAPLVGAPAQPASQEESFAAWRHFCESLAEERPTVLVVEDLHWADPALLAFLEHLAEWADSVPLLLLCTARPELYEQHPAFGANARNAQRINLAPLTDPETAQLLSVLVEEMVLPQETQRVLLERAGGNPLYAEEFVRLLTDRGSEQVEVPESVQALIAARLDTLPPDRKSLLQDAAALGKVFWSGALAEMGSRDLAEVEQTLHELARKELVRFTRTSSMEGEQEYGFWHVLVRDVCYAQIPRAARAARHLAAAAWIAEKAGERVEDLADVLAHHYQAALELNRAAGGVEQDEALQAQAMHYLALAGERSLSLDVDRAVRQIGAALELAPDGNSARASLLERWAHAIQQQGRLLEAKDALEEALELFRRLDQPISAGRVLSRLAMLFYRLGDPRSEQAITESVDLLSAQPAGPELVSAYGYLAGRCTLTSRYAEAATAAERALRLAEELGLPEAAFALHWRGIARCALGEADGLDDVRRALRFAVGQGQGREAAIIHENFASIVASYEGPQAALDAFDDALAFSARRGIAEVALHVRAERPGVLADLGRTDQAIAEAGPAADETEAIGDIQQLSAKVTQLRLLAERGASEATLDPLEFVSTVREIGIQTYEVVAFTAAAQLLAAQRRCDEARALLHELDQRVTVRAELIPVLPSLLRLAVILNKPSLARRLAAGITPVTPLDENAVASGRAQLAEAAGDVAGAAELYAGAAEGWQRFGNVPERAYALLGQGRCLAALNLPGAAESLRGARNLFASMCYRPALAETETLLGENAG